MIINRAGYDAYYQRIRDLYQQPVVSVSVEVILNIFVVAFLVTFVIRPTFGVVASLKKQTEDQRIVDTKLTSKINSLNQARGTLAEQAAFLPLYTSAVSKESDLDGLVLRIEKLASEYQIQLTGLKLGGVALLGDDLELDKGKGVRKVSTEKANEVSMSFTVEGSFARLTPFLSDMQKMDRLVKVDGVSFSKDKKSKTGLVAMSGTAHVYYMPSKSL